MHAYLIYNPNAGGLTKSRCHRVHRAIGVLQSRGIEVTEGPTQRAHHATELARAAIEHGVVSGAQAASGPRRPVDLIIAAGGDGTINEVANGMIGSRVPLAILPAGTANVLAKEMRLASRIRDVAGALPHMVPRRIAAGRFTPARGSVRHFLLMAGAGLDADIVHRVHGPAKLHMGKLAYWIAGFSQIGRRLPQIEVAVHERRITAGFALAARVRNYGGTFEIARHVTLFDENFEAAIFDGRTTWPFAKYLAGLLTGNLGAMKGVSFLRTCCIEMEPKDRTVFVQVDGEHAGELPGRFDIVADALTLMTPADLPGRYGQPHA